MIVIQPFDKRRIADSLADIWRHRELLLILTSRAVMVRYKQAVIGVLWVVLQPVIATAIYTVVFGLFVHVPSEGVPYPLFVFSGLLVWNYFSRIILEGSASLLANAPLITKVYFPRSLVPLVPPAAGALDCAISVVLVVCLALLLGIWPGWPILFVPLVVLWVGLLGYSMSLWLAPMHAVYRDFSFLVPFAVQLAMYVSPVVYPSGLVPEKLRLIYSLNPVSVLVDAMRWSLFGGTPPSAVALATLTVLTALLLCFGIRFFHRMESTLVDRI
jgi:lipopolysaccharide transport system permease protein